MCFETQMGEIKGKGEKTKSRVDGGARLID